MYGIHLAEVPLHAEEDVSAHDEPIGVLLIVGGDGVGQVSRLVQDVVNRDFKGHQYHAGTDAGIIVQVHQAAA